MPLCAPRPSTRYILPHRSLVVTENVYIRPVLPSPVLRTLVQIPVHQLPRFRRGLRNYFAIIEMNPRIPASSSNLYIRIPHIMHRVRSHVRRCKSIPSCKVPKQDILPCAKVCRLIHCISVVVPFGLGLSVSCISCRFPYFLSPSDLIWVVDTRVVQISYDLIHRCSNLYSVRAG